MADCGKLITARMNKRITIQSKTRASDDMGGFTEGWSSLMDVWASIDPVKGYEKFQAAQYETPVTHKIMIRYVSGITTSNRILYGARILNIKEIINVEENNFFLKLTVMEKQ